MSAAARAFEIGPGVRGDLDALVNTRLLVQANSGAGKSWCLRRLLEQTHGRIQHLVIDPEGEFASLRERFDYVLAAKRDGDTVADPRHAKLLAERLLELGVSAILDIYELAPQERVRFVRFFLEAVVDAPKTLWHPALVVLDEAHMYAPERGEAESADAVKGLATRGRKRGFCLVAATQRLSKLHKDVAAECNNKLIGRSSLDVDMKRAADELGFTSKAEQLSLRDLDRGEFFAFGPALSRTVTRVRVGGVTTTHPKAGSHLAAVVPPPTDKVRAVLAKLADLPQEAERKATTEAELRGQIQTLHRDLTAAKRAAPAPVVARVEVPVFSDADRAALDRCRLSVESMLAAASEIRDSLATVARAVQTRVSAAAAPVPRAVVAPTSGRAPAPVRSAVSRGAGELMPAGERKILTALAHYPDGRTKIQVAVLSGYAVSGGGFNNYLGALRSKGWISTGGDPLRITDDGLAALGAVEPLPTGDDLIQHWRGQLGKAERSIFNVLVDAWPRALSKEDLGAAANYEANGGGFNNALGRLRTLELVTRGQPIKASDELFSGEGS